LAILKPKLRLGPVASMPFARFARDSLQSRHGFLTSRLYAGSGSPPSGVAPAP
jgi:hypothetical protein